MEVSGDTDCTGRLALLRYMLIEGELEDTRLENREYEEASCMAIADAMALRTVSPSLSDPEEQVNVF